MMQGRGLLVLWAENRQRTPCLPAVGSLHHLVEGGLLGDVIGVGGNAFIGIPGRDGSATLDTGGVDRSALGIEAVAIEWLLAAHEDVGRRPQARYRLVHRASPLDSVACRSR
jgi:hypothetical protein